MNNEKYNGWTNYETWSVALWIDENKGAHEAWRETANDFFNTSSKSEGLLKQRHAAIYRLADCLKAAHMEFMPQPEIPDVYSQLLQGALSEVNWDEIAEGLINEVIA